MPEQHRFERLISEVTGERALSDRQATFVDGVIARLASDGAPFTDNDVLMARWIGNIVGLDDDYPS